MSLPHYRVIVLLIVECLQRHADDENDTLLSLHEIAKVFYGGRLRGLATNGGGFTLILEQNYPTGREGFEYYKDGKVIKFSVKQEKVTKARIEALEDILDTLQSKLTL